MAYQQLTFRPGIEHKTLLPALERLAKKEDRKLNKYIERVLVDHVRRHRIKKTK